ncbi:unnamed protein product [Anisakis simplex]|uniref:MARVEL domain-containing protein n=1 Tax=Anisakis simplex TaxID=6269 RepID=A0A0M3JY58_ANISI|nr:unnamed protein product [Anisakis simplex]
MANSNDRYTTRTTVVTSQERIQPTVFVEIERPELDIGYLRTLSGLVKCIAIALDFVCFICLLVGGPGYYTATGGATFVAVTGMTISLTLLCLYLFRVVDVLSQVPWITCEMIFCFMWTVLYFICGCVLAVAAAQLRAVTGFGAASFFAFGAMCTYAFDCYLKFLAWRNNEIATGGGPVDIYGDSANAETGLRKRINVTQS